MTTITKEGEKALKALEKERKKELDDLEKKHKQETEKIAGEWKAEKADSKLKKLRFWGSSTKGATKDPRYWALVNVAALQEFVKYGANKVMDQIRVRTHANIMAREEIERIKNEKKGFDGKSFAFTMIILVVAAAMAFIIVSNFFNYKTVQDDNIALSRQYGEVQGDLAVCRKQLEQYQPTGIFNPAEKAQDNTLEG